MAAILCLAPPAAFAAPTDSTPQTSPLERVQALVQPAVVYEEITFTSYVYDGYNKHRFRDDPFTVTYQCTGFIVSPDGYIATAGHCVDFDSSVKAAILEQVADWAFENDYYSDKPSRQVIEGEKTYWRTDGASTEGTPDLTVNVAYGVSVSGEPSGKAMPARLVSKRAFDQGDVALLKIDAKDLTVIPLSKNTKTGVGTQVVAVGYPVSVDLVTDASFNPSFKEGAISAQKTTSGGLLPVYEISAAVSGGMSGGPTVGLDGEVIGVNSFKIVGESQPFNFVQPAQNMAELIRAEGVADDPGEVTTLYRKGLDAYFAGEKDTAISSFQRVLEIVPSHQFAQEYLRKARTLPDNSAFGSLLWIGLGGLFLVGVALVLGLFLILRRRKAPVAVGVPATAPAVGGMVPPAPGQAPHGARMPMATMPGAPGQAPPMGMPPAPTQAPPMGMPPAPGPFPPAPPAAPPAATAPPAGAPTPTMPLPTPPPPPAGAPAATMPLSTPPPPPAGVGAEAAQMPASAAAPPADTAPDAPEPEKPVPSGAEASGDRFCPECGKPHSPDDHFCPSCGHRFN